MPGTTHIQTCALVGFLSFVSLWSTALAQSSSPSNDKSSGGTISGRIVIDQKPADGVSVVLSPCDHQRATISAPQSISATTNSEGEYKLDKVPAGSYCINAYSPLSSGVSRQGRLEKILTIADGETV